MREDSGDLFALAAEHDAWIVVTTNGCLTMRGELVMGAGVAKTAAQHHPGLALALGVAVRTHGNVPTAYLPGKVLSWPTKPDKHTTDGIVHPGWMRVTRIHDPDCVRQVSRLVWHGAPKLVALADRFNLDEPIFTPRPGCGLGGLNWRHVRPHLAGVLDDRFVVISPAR